MYTNIVSPQAHIILLIVLQILQNEIPMFMTSQYSVGVVGVQLSQKRQKKQIGNTGFNNVMSPKISNRLFWVPGHIVISGNQRADERVADASFRSNLHNNTTTH